MTFAREGYPFAAAGLFLAGMLWVCVWAGFGVESGGDLGTEVGRALREAAEVVGAEGGGGARLGALAVALRIGAVSATVLALFVLWFFRDPAPVLPTDPALVVAPGHGKVILVEEVDEATYLEGPATKISIFLSVFDVHVQRAPVSGRVEHKEYRPGAFVAAWADKASEDNEQASLGIATDNGRVLVKQIAGLVARRIVTDPATGDSVERGRRFGLIRFGSRVDLFLPRHWEVLSSVGDRVRVGSTVLARQRAGGA